MTTGGTITSAIVSILSKLLHLANSRNIFPAQRPDSTNLPQAPPGPIRK